MHISLCAILRCHLMHVTYYDHASMKLKQKLTCLNRNDVLFQTIALYDYHNHKLLDRWTGHDRDVTKVKLICTLKHLAQRCFFFLNSTEHEIYPAHKC